jgi:hypothetical protein
MSYDHDNDLQRALERLTIQDVWRRVGLPDSPRDGNVVVKSPFRDDRKGKAFSIFKRGVLAKDQGTGEVFSIFKFAEKASGLAGKELVDRLCEWANVTRTVHVRQQLRDVCAAVAEGKVVELSPELRKLSRRLERQNQIRTAEARLYQQLDDMRNPKVTVRDLHPWSEVVRGRYLEGWREMKGDGKRIDDWSKDRGWPVEWVSWLLDRGLIAMPWVPWTVPGAKYAQRGKAFAVDCPVLDDQGAFIELRRIGYHQRYFILGDKLADGTRAQGEKQWTYVPYMPEEEKQKTEFQRQMVSVELGRGGEIGVSRVAGVPFAFGDFMAPRFVCVTEGQWDAVTFAGACGWLAMDPSEWGAAVMGVRGNEGADTMIAYWGKWFALHKPSVLVLADNDAAGRKWDQAEAREPGQPVPPTLAEKLKAAGARRVYVSRIRPELGKDFNDYWKARRPSVVRMSDWLQQLGFFDAAGSLA